MSNASLNGMMTLRPLEPPTHRLLVDPAPEGDVNPDAVFRQPLKLFSTQPMTGFHRDGYCRTSAMDRGSHAVAGVVSEQFLDYTARQGNDLRPVGLREGCKWCLCTARWLQAFRAFESGTIPRSAVPKIDLEATEESALRSVDLETLRAFAVEGQRQQGQQTNGVNGVNEVNGH